MHLFVTGATGFIGGALARAFHLRGDQLTLLVRDRGRLGSELSNCSALQGDLSEPEGLSEASSALAEAEVVIHAAAIRKSWGVAPEQLIEANVEGTRRLLVLAKNARRFVYVSSVGVYGHPTQTPVDESTAFKATTVYGEAKCAAEQLVIDEARRLGVAYTIVRPVITYGAGDTYGMIPQLLRLLKKRRYLLVGDGLNRVHLSAIEDLVSGVVLAVESAKAEGEDFILCGPEPIRMRELVALAADAVSVKAPPVYLPEPLARPIAAVLELAWRAVGSRNEPIVTRGKIDIVCRDRAFSHAKASRLLGYKPSWDYQTGIPRAARWLEEQGLL